jgi:hypothetical protein
MLAIDALAGTAETGARDLVEEHRREMWPRASPTASRFAAIAACCVSITSRRAAGAAYWAAFHSL